MGWVTAILIIAAIILIWFIGTNIRDEVRDVEQKVDEIRETQKQQIQNQNLNNGSLVLPMRSVS